MPSEYATSVQRLPNVVQTSWTFGQWWVDVVQTSRVYWGISVFHERHKWENINVLWLQTINKEIIVKYYGRSRKIRIIMEVYSVVAVHCRQHFEGSRF